jgi:hypothetical protein
MNKQRRKKGAKHRRTWAPRLKHQTRQDTHVHVDPLHASELRSIARHAGTSMNFVLDEILCEYFKGHSPRYGEEE